MGGVIIIWDELLFKFRVSVDGMITRKKVILEYSNLIEKNNDVVVEVLKVYSSISFELCLDEYFVECW